MSKRSMSPPLFRERSFDCPHCHAYAGMEWWHLGTLPNLFDAALDASEPIRLNYSGVWSATCASCSGRSIWLDVYDFGGSCERAEDGIMLWPKASNAPEPNNDMPEDVRAEYDEASRVLANSPRAAAALLRLAIQRLCIHLGQKGKNLNDDIGDLVKQGLSPEIQKSLDIVRVIGNNAVHPGELSSDDVAETAYRLFPLVNSIVKDRITRARKSQDLQTLYNTLPQGAREAIAKRDKPKPDGSRPSGDIPPG